MRILIIFLLLAFAGSVPAAAQQVLAERIAAAGFDRVRVASTPEELTIWFENGAFRNHADALRRLVSISGSAAGDRPLHLIPMHRQIPLGTIQISPGSGMDRLAASPHVRRMSATGGRADNAPLADLVLYPEIATQLGNFSDPVGLQVNLVPSASVGLWPGMTAHAQLILPLYNELDIAEDDVRPGLLVLHQLLRAPGASFLEVAGGFFSSDRYGLDVRGRSYFFDGRLQFGARVGYTGFLTYDEGTWRYGDLDQLTPSLFADLIVLPEYGLHLRARYGRFLFGDVGATVAVERRFGEMRVGFFGAFTDAGRNAGLTLSVPLPGSRYARLGPLRVRPGRALAWTYRYRRLPGTLARDYRTEPLPWEMQIVPTGPDLRSALR